MIDYKNLDIAVETNDVVAMHKFVVDFGNSAYGLLSLRDSSLENDMRIARQKLSRVKRSIKEMSPEFSYCLGLWESAIHSCEVLIKDIEFERILSSIVSNNKAAKEVIDMLFVSNVIRHVDLSSAINMRKEELTKMLKPLLSNGVIKSGGCGDTTRYWLTQQTKRIWERSTYGRNGRVFPEYSR